MIDPFGDVTMATSEENKKIWRCNWIINIGKLISSEPHVDYKKKLIPLGTSYWIINRPRIT